MGEIRAFEDSDISGVESLHLKLIRQQPRSTGSDLQQYFRDIFFGNPWYSEDLPSLVYVHEGRIAGFLGVIPRPMTFAGRPIRAATATQLMVDTGSHRAVAPLQLLLRFLEGPQDVSYMEGATRPAFELWKRAGAHPARLYSLEWTRVQRPMRFVRSTLAEKGGNWRALAKVTAPAGALVDAALSRVPLRVFAAPSSEYASEWATAMDVLETIQDIGWREPLRPAYEPESFGWLMHQTADARFNGTLRLRIVRNPKGDRVGWFVYFAKRHGVSVVMQLGARGRDMDSVFRALLQDAWDQGSAAVRGQAIPGYLTSFHYQHCFWHVGPGVFVHARDPEVQAAVLRGDAALSRLDGESWTRFV